jgi:hypothetical protein
MHCCYIEVRAVQELLGPEEAGDIIIQNVDNYTLNLAALQPRIN